MKIYIASLSIAALCLVGFSGCGQKSVLTDPAPPTEQAHDDHNHSDDGLDVQDHSVMGHAHGTGPHDGVIADWGGGKYHVEFTVDHDQTKATAFILGPDEKTANPIDVESIELAITDPQMLLTLEASPQPNDPPGQSSRFVGTHEKLGVVQEYAGTMTGVVDGTPYSGDFAE